MRTPDIVLCAPVRTPIGSYGGALKDTPAPDAGCRGDPRNPASFGMAAPVVDTVVMGNVIQAGNRMNPARQAAIGGGLPVQVPALTVNRVCGSGAQAIATAAHRDRRRLCIDVAVAGGMENMDRAPYLMGGGAGATAWATRQMLDSMLRDGLNDAFSRPALGLAHRRSRQPATASRARIRIAGPRARSSASPPRRRQASSRTRSSRSNCPAARDR